MNEITRVQHPGHDEMVRVLQNSLYPGAKPESIELVLSYCRVNGIDPLLKPVHIVPQRVKNERGQWESRDILMPGIADYRIKAARSGEYGGKGEPEYGPDVTETMDGVRITYPAWCRVTISRIVAGQARTFVAKEYWLENYRAGPGSDTTAPNSTWRKRPYAQLAKCAESQALRMAFPEFSGGQPSAEEMGGGEAAEAFNGPTIDAAPPAPAQPEYMFATANGGQIFHTGSEWMERWRRLVEICRTKNALAKLSDAAAMNAGPIAAVAEFDPQAAAEVRELLEATLGAPIEPGIDQEIEREMASAEAEMGLPE